MDAGDWIFLVQTVIVLLTGCIVYYYARETHKLRKTSERHMQIAAKTGLLAACMQNLTVIEMQNVAGANFRVPRKDTSKVTAEIEKLEAEIKRLTVESD
jgi:hypothetical protein